jgi:hypothetical protein
MAATFIATGRQYTDPASGLHPNVPTTMFLQAPQTTRDRTPKPKPRHWWVADKKKASGLELCICVLRQLRLLFVRNLLGGTVLALAGTVGFKIDLQRLFAGAQQVNQAFFSRPAWIRLVAGMHCRLCRMLTYAHATCTCGRLNADAV